MSDKSLKQALLDFQTEMKGLLLEDAFLLHGKMWTLKLLNEEEQTWATSMLNMTTTMSAYMSTRLAALAIGTRRIDGVEIYEYFQEDWIKLDEADRRALESENRFARKYFVAEHMHQFLAEMPSELINDLWSSWTELEGRRQKSQDMSKKSSGETSQPTSDEN